MDWKSWVINTFGKRFPQVWIEKNYVVDIVTLSGIFKSKFFKNNRNLCQTETKTITWVELKNLLLLIVSHKIVFLMKNSMSWKFAKYYFKQNFMPVPFIITFSWLHTNKFKCPWNQKKKTLTIPNKWVPGLNMTCIVH